MNFKDLENAVIGETIFVDEDGFKRFFMGFTPNKKRILTVTDDGNQNGSSWLENGIKDWKIKQPERETIQMYDTIDNCGNYCLCDENGKYPHFLDKNLVGENQGNELRKRNIIKPSIKIYADTFEIVRE